MATGRTLRVETPPTREGLGQGAIVFGDEYEAHGWAPMPDRVPRRGASACSMAAATFERLEAAEVPTHYRGVVQGDAVQPLDSVDTPPSTLSVDVARVPKLPYPAGSYDYESYHREGGTTYLLPLSVGYRHEVPPDSSFRDRARPAEHGLQGDEWPAESVTLPEPAIEFVATQETRERYLDRDEAAQVAGPVDLDRLADLALEVASVVAAGASRMTDRASATSEGDYAPSDAASPIEVTHQHGRIDVLMDDGVPTVAGVVGTFDTDGFSAGGLPLSTAFLGAYYREVDPDWVAAVEDAKLEARVEDVEDWRSLCSVSPKPLPDHVLSAVSKLYAAGANAYTGRELFEAPSLAVAIRRLERL
jgi:phosphoribosylaminoimidazole-succinocarboxamide synthase